MTKRVQRQILYAVLVTAVWFYLAGCQSDYTRMVKEEMAKGVRYDSVLLGINFGDSNHDFFGRCYDLNAAGVITQGTGVSVRYVLSDSVDTSLAAPLAIDFYPTFDQNFKIAELRLKFGYVGWNGWNKSLHSDSLRLKVMSLMKEWYGGNDFVIARLDSTELPVKVDGNRRIIVSILDASQVEAQIQDIMNPMFMHSIYRKEEKDPPSAN
jgi:hypothetical protein